MSEFASIVSQHIPTPAAVAVPEKPSEVGIYTKELQCLPIQRKLSIGSVDDPLEHEADAVADRVMRMPEPFIQRKCAECEKEEEVQRKPLVSSITPFIQTKGAEGGTASEAIGSQISATRGSGRSMDKNTKSFMESRFGTDFSGVRIHTSDYAVHMSQELNAQAFTVGSDIYFNSGKYAPESTAGKHLLAHELTHTVQQDGSANDGIRQKAQQHLVQRKWKIRPRTTGTNPLRSGGETDEKILEDGFKEICPLTARSGNIISLASGPPTQNRTEGCNCLSVIDSQIGTLFTSDPEVQVEPSGWSQTGGLGSGAVLVSVRHPDDPFGWGYWTGTTATHPTETRHSKPFWQTLAHEICGHVAAAARSGGAAVGARGVGTGHNDAITGENLVAGEHGVSLDEQRGMDINAATGKPMPGHRGESFLEATVSDFAHASDVLPASQTTVIDAVVNTVRTTGVSLEMLIQVEGFAHPNEGGISIAQSRASNVRNEIIRRLTAARLSLTTSAGSSRFSANLATIAPGASAPNKPDAGRRVKVYLFHQTHSAGP